MKQPTVLVDLTKLRKLVKDLKLGDPQRNEDMEARWLNYVEWWDSRAGKAKWKHLAIRSTVVIAAALIPALVGLRELKDWGDHGWVFSVLSIGASVVVAIGTGLDSLFNYGDIWREKRTAAELIKSEGFSFIQRIGVYKTYATHDAAFQHFADNVEKLILSEIKNYTTAVDEKTPPGGKTP